MRRNAGWGARMKIAVMLEEIVVLEITSTDISHNYYHARQGGAGGGERIA